MVELADTLASGASEPTLMGVQVPLRARASDFEQCAGFASVSYERKTLQAFFDFRLNQSKSEQWSFAAFQKLQFLESFLNFNSMRCLKLSHYNIGT